MSVRCKGGSQEVFGSMLLCNVNAVVELRMVRISGADALKGLMTPDASSSAA
eukprot:CAMPEP_0114321272 /NCGR_PEP_ID=MMETSP0059-20121206/26477_1 /TAXON_ID=36894 /ORGANISM="Pyramimonas parkeae, Strain CCMP726" /LENGTH=51 /DNA_ID=CAMNT_0001448917 /DNA_START=330 /DNA_END=485 /DNA_ORIENTATION=+